MSGEQLDTGGAVIDQPRFELSMITRKGVAAVVTGALALGGGVFGASLISSKGESHGPAVALADSSGNNACDQFEISAAGTNEPARFDSGAFLPRNTVSNDESAKTFINNLFGKQGTIAKGSPDSLAALMATVAIPAERGVVNDPNYDYVKAYQDKIAAYNAAGGKQVASDDCNKAFSIITQVAGYNNQWARSGDKVSTFKANRNGAYEIDSAELTRPEVTQGTLSGVELVLRNTTKGVNGEPLQGFASVLIAQDGNLYIKGLRPTQSGRSTKHKGVGGNQPSHNNAPAANQQNQNQNGQNTGKAGPNKGGNSGGSVNPGNTPEKNLGPAPNGKPEAKTGPTHPTPGPGPETNTNTTPNTTTTPTNTTSTETNTTTTPTNTTTTTETNTTSTETNTTFKPSPPACEPNPPYVIC